MALGNGGSASMRLTAIVAARMESSRLPGKSMAVLAGRPALAHVASRLRRSRYLDGVIIATSDHPADDAIRGCARDLGIPCYSGSHDDVLKRTRDAARWAGVEHIVQVTGDCPLIDPAVVDRVIGAYLTARPDYASNVLRATYPNGMDTEVFPLTVLDEVDTLTRDPADREHVTLYIYEHPEKYRLLNVDAPAEHTWPELRLSIDTPEDYALVRVIYDTLYGRNPAFGLDDILTFLRRRPDLVAMNAQVQQRQPRESR